MHGLSCPYFLFIEPARSDEVKLYESRLFKKMSHKIPGRVITEVNVETKLDDAVLKNDDKEKNERKRKYVQERERENEWQFYSKIYG